jgi:ATP-dependent Clp protease ATP-binding subunit ClpC
MRETRIEPELAELREAAETLARKRKERPSTAHLLAAVATRSGATRDLLEERKLDAESVLGAADGARDAGDDPLRGALKKAREIARRMGVPITTTPHVLVALLGDRHTAAHQAVVRIGLDVNRLRSAALHLALGYVGKRRVVSRAPALAPKQAGSLAPSRSPGAPSRESSAPNPSPTSSTPASASRRSEPRPRGIALSVVPNVGRTRRGRATKPAATSPLTVTDLLEEPSEVPNDATDATPQAAPRAPTPSAPSFELDAKRMPLLSSLGQNLTLAARRGQLEAVIGRDTEIEHALDVLAKRQGNNPVLVGVAGVGKSSVVRGIAQYIAREADANSCDARILVEIPIADLVAGTGVRGALASRVTTLRKEVAASNGRVVLCFDDIDQLFTGEAADEMAGELKLALARGELPCIGTCSREAYAKVIDGDPALARRFTAIDVEEPSREDAYLVLDSVSTRLAEHHKLRFVRDAIALAVGWSVRYLPGKALPDKAVSVLDLAGARARRRGLSSVDAAVVAEVVSDLADMPVERLLETDGDRLLRLETLLGDRVVGHHAQLERIARILRRNAAGLGGNRPLGSFLLLGPTGVGKTETAKALAEVLFQTDTALTRIDLSEYSEPHAVARLIGAPPGYVGHDAGGQLTEAVRRRPYQVILLDEVEKAHPDVLLSFLALLDEGRMTDGRGRTVDFTNTVILLTSNLGAHASGATRKRRVGFGSEGAARTELEAGVIAAARDALAPELYNRIDEVLVFSPLERSAVLEIARRLLASLGKRVATDRGARLEYDEAALNALLDAGGYDPSLGARPLRRTLARLVEAPLAELILRGEVERGSVVLLSAKDAGVDLDVIPAARGSA